MVEAAVGVQTEIELNSYLSFVEVEHLHQPEGWFSPGYVCIDSSGLITSVSEERPEAWQAAAATTFKGYALPGFANLHSHSFQRAMAGFAEHLGGVAATDSFWTWRQVMYTLAGQIEPEEIQAVAAQAFVEMTEAGMTTVGEFHYLHHAPGGQPYDTQAELSFRVLAAAAEVGIAITHLPVLYVHGGFGAEISPEQCRFASRTVDDYLSLVEGLRGVIKANASMRLGMAAHSLRAVTAVELREALAGVEHFLPDAPVHIHIAEQVMEVEECVVELGQRPVDYLLDHFEVDERWCLVHATHTDANERSRLAHSKAVAGLCPSTEANLGDGLFALTDHLALGGRIGIGSDSQIGISVAEELRLLEYGQRLTFQRRNVVAQAKVPLGGHSGRRLVDLCLSGGAQALQQPIGSIRPGYRADMIFLDADHPRLSGHDRDSVCDAYVFSAGDAALRDVMIAGRLVVENGRHYKRDQVQVEFSDAMRVIGERLR